MRRTLALLVALPALVACGPPPETPALGCDTPRLTDLGYVTTGRHAWFTTSGGRARFSVTDPFDGSVNFTPDDRTVHVGDATTTPEYRSAESSRIVNDLDSVRADPEHPGTMDLDPGAYWVATYATHLTMATCSDTTITEVVPAIGTVATSTPFPTRDVSQEPPDRPVCTPPGSSCAPAPEPRQP